MTDSHPTEQNDAIMTEQNNDATKADDVLTVEHMEISTSDAPEKGHAEEEEDNTKDEVNPADDDKEDDSSSTTLAVDDDDDDISIDKDADLLTTEQVEERLMQATTWKEQGNAAFQKGDLDPAARAYRKGVALLKPVQQRLQFLDSTVNGTSEQEQYKSLSVALQTNLSMVCYKQQKYSHALKVASQALLLDPTNIKALYRRALAHRALGNWDDARTDLKQALQQDPNNTACKKEFLSLKQQMDGLKSSQKKALAKAFSSKSSSFLYDDKEAAERRKLEQQEQQKKMEQELYKKRKAQWEDECVQRMAKNEPAISFEEWEKEQKEIEAAEKKQEEEKRKEEEKKRREERKQAEAQRKKEQKNDKDDDSDDDALTEEELKLMRGYKKTKDGRTTSYFTRELSTEEKQQLGDMAPKRLDEVAPQPARLPVATPTATAAASKWNQAGTWEEKDTTAWCKESLEQRLKDTTVEDSTLEVSISKVDDLTGDASVAITGGKKRYIFDFHVKLKYEMKETGTDDVIAKGSVALPDICSGHHEEIEINFSAWSRKPPSALATSAQDMQQRLAKQLRANIQAWVEDFNAQY
ncbi:hypothetical protein FisN_28Lh042 [Fistulifera solaris]|uniref:peptidylprolyl isomerase n=1 Tax=Fistulifera solaris TaxID=1519565 RepID=A0A1Z5KSB7_FISSO|nr:hypothetical protein FisN_28Lh042 [Fistulifera solaris]|eukprot:GAX29214.1 hypothetical protein FisN_28Lh042 [Fistulifera solaris]